VLINAYFPNTRHDHSRLAHKLRFCRAIRRRMDAIRASGKNVIVCGDFNIAHREIDLANPKGNKNNAGFLPQERRWMDRTVRASYIDCFRHFCDEPGHYTWWSYRAGVRARNVGWRIDMFVANAELKRRLRGVEHQKQVRGSDHCPISLELK
jgi:exodeoxyribonuclease-3